MQKITVEEIDAIYAQQVANTWQVKQTSIAQRTTWLGSLKQIIRIKEEEIKAAIYKDFRKSPIETETTQILASLLDIDLSIKNLKRWAKPRSVNSSLLFASTEAKLHYEPKGNTLILTPWNYPFQLPIVHLVASQAAGNTVISKLSEATPHINVVINDIISNLFERKHVAVMVGEVEETTQLLSLKFDHIHFTGSPNVGKIIMAAAAKNLSAVTLELGG